MKKLLVLFASCLFCTSVYFFHTPSEAVKASSDIYNKVIKENGNYKLVSVRDTSLEEYRIYSSSKIDEIADDAFSISDHKYSVMISNYVTQIHESAFSNNLEKILFTGDESEWAKIGYSFTNVYFYQCDEGFINYWNTFIRPNSDSNICAIPRTTYGYVKLLYDSLNSSDLASVNSYVDKSGNSISSSMEYLINYFETPVNPNVSYLSKNSTITLIIVISVIGMTAIAGLYLLKKKHIIY